MSLINPVAETTLIVVQDNTSTEASKYVSVRRFWNGITRVFNLANNWIALQTFNSINTKQIYTTKQSITVIGSNPVQNINLDNGSYILLDLTGASGTVTITLSNGKVGGSYFIQVVQAVTAVNISLSNEGRFDGGIGSTIVGINSTNYCIFPLYTGTEFLLNVSNLS